MTTERFKYLSDLIEEVGPPWKVGGDELLPYHPSASHIPPDYRDGWNRCYLMRLDALRARTRPEEQAAGQVPQPLSPEPGWSSEEIEEVICSLGDDAAKLRDANEEDEMSFTMDRAASMIQVFSDHLAALAAPAQAMQPLSEAARDVLAERRRQIEAEGWTPEHDDEHGDGSMAYAAACYAVAGRPGSASFGNIWAWTGWAAKSFKPKDRRSNLIRATALLLAEIERRDRAAHRIGTPDPTSGASEGAP